VQSFENNNDELIIKEQENTLSPSSSLTSGTDVYMDAVEVFNDENHDTKSGKDFFWLFRNIFLFLFVLRWFINTYLLWIIYKRYY